MPPTNPAPDRPRPTRAEAARLNGARSRGPLTPAGKRRSAMNALKHGLTAECFALAPGEDGAAYRQLLDRLAARYRPADEVAAHLVQRLASVMWRQYRADRLEAEVLATREQRPDPSYLGGYLPASPHAWDAGRFSAVQRQQARLDRLLFRLLDELDHRTPAPLPNVGAAAANDDAQMPNEPEPHPPAAEPLAPPPPREPPLSERILPLTPELAALLARPDEEAGRLFAEGRRRQVDAALKAWRGSGAGAPAG